MDFRTRKQYPYRQSKNVIAKLRNKSIKLCDEVVKMIVMNRKNYYICKAYALFKNIKIK